MTTSDLSIVIPMGSIEDTLLNEFSNELIEQVIKSYKKYLVANVKFDKMVHLHPVVEIITSLERQYENRLKELGLPASDSLFSCGEGSVMGETNNVPH